MGMASSAKNDVYFGNILSIKPATESIGEAVARKASSPTKITTQNRITYPGVNCYFIGYSLGVPCSKEASSASSR